MEEFEKKAIEEAEFKPKIWIRYVDDVLALWQHGEEKLDEFLAHLNRQNTAIQFTMEKEDRNELAFLDVKIMKSGANLSFKVHRKATHSDLYIYPVELQPRTSIKNGSCKGTCGSCLQCVLSGKPRRRTPLHRKNTNEERFSVQSHQRIHQQETPPDLQPRPSGEQRTAN